jgi:hypothetical protein
MPDYLFGLLVILFAILIGVGGLLLTRNYVATLHRVYLSNEVVSYYLGTLAVFYGIMLGLISVGVWEGFTEARMAVGLEAGSLAAVYRDVSAYPEPLRSSLQEDLRDYTRYQIDVAWALHRKGIITRGGVERLWRFQDKLETFVPQTEAQKAIHMETLRAYDELIRQRSLRLDTINSHLPRPLWHFVIVGALLCFAVSWFFQPKSFSLHVWMTVIFAALLGLEIQLMMLMNNPYRGSIGVASDAFEVVYNMLMGGSR